jgi:hypothetical protein
MIGLTSLLLDHKKDSNRCEISLESYCDHMSTGREAEVAEQIAVAAKAIRLEKGVCVVRNGSRTTVQGQLTLYKNEEYRKAT